jgi:uncharacterized protein (TIGR00255 family)
MISSMTGFGTGRATSDLGEVTVEVKSLNNRFLDLNIKLPRELHVVEMQLRDLVKRRIRRGKVDLFLRWTAAPGAQPLYEINQTLLLHYARQTADVLQQLNAENKPAVPEIAGLLGLPGVVAPSSAASEDGAMVQLATQALEQALSGLETFRAHEGEQLVAAIHAHLDVLEQLRSEIETQKDSLLEDYRTRLKERLEHLMRASDATLDPARLEAELILHADRSEITEELVRLDAHFKSFRKTLASKSNEPVGKPLDFLVQELLREANTIGNKARGVAVAQLVVQMKTEIEKIREQVQNLE